jgi:hypothetical protein
MRFLLFSAISCQGHTYKKIHLRGISFSFSKWVSVGIKKIPEIYADLRSKGTLQEKCTKKR